MIQFLGASPLHWFRRCFNVQADHLCHYTLGIQRSWCDVRLQPGNVVLDKGSCLVGWSDGGFDRLQGGTAGFLIAVWRANSWRVIMLGGIFDKDVVANDALRMEALGMEEMLKEVKNYLSRMHS